MPNWCYISAVISHNDAEKIGELASTLENEDTFEHFIPVPKELVEQTDPDVLAIGITTLGSDEYDWRMSNWGTKWDICRSEIIDREDKMLLIQFETAWSPPIPVFREMKKQGYVIEAEYWEEGGFYVGKWEDGNDRCFSPDKAPEDMAHLVANYGPYPDEDGETTTAIDAQIDAQALAHEAATNSY
jgi:hypothetical protein